MQILDTHKRTGKPFGQCVHMMAFDCSFRAQRTERSRQESCEEELMKTFGNPSTDVVRTCVSVCNYRSLVYCQLVHLSPDSFKGRKSITWWLMTSSLQNPVKLWPHQLILQVMQTNPQLRGHLESKLTRKEGWVLFSLQASNPACITVAAGCD